MRACMVQLSLIRNVITNNLIVSKSVPSIFKSVVRCVHIARLRFERAIFFCCCCMDKITRFLLARCVARYSAGTNESYFVANINHVDVEGDENNYRLLVYGPIQYTIKRRIIKASSILSNRIMKTQSFVKFRQERLDCTVTTPLALRAPNSPYRTSDKIKYQACSICYRIIFILITKCGADV